MNAKSSRLESLEPRPLWAHFFALSAIPRGSKNEGAAAEYVVKEARRLNLEVQKDKAGNVLVRKGATAGRERAPATILQGHLDMVCEKNESKKHDFLKDPISLILDGDFVKADGTTLGADNGIGVAAALAVMESSGISHGPLEFLFTVDEETGLTGALNLEPNWLSGHRLINLDTEEDGSIYIGCAGGIDSVAKRKFAITKPQSDAAPIRLKVTGLRGGHSGLDIHLGRGNALKLITRVLRTLSSVARVELASLNGGSKRNAIPREAFALVFVERAKLSEIRSLVEKLKSEIKSELGAADPDFELAIDEPESAQAANSHVLISEHSRHLVSFVHACCHGVLAMTPDIPGLVQTSTNLAIVETSGDSVTISMSHRSSIESAKLDVVKMIDSYCELAGFDVSHGTGYPGWKPNLRSDLLQSAKQIYLELFGREPQIKAVHAGLECGIIGERYPGIDTISIGPNIFGAHSPDERVSVSSVNLFWNYLKSILAKI